MAANSTTSGEGTVEGMVDPKDTPPEKNPGIVAGPYNTRLSLSVSYPEPDSQEPAEAPEA